MFYDLSFHERFSKRRKENSIVPWPCLTYSKSLTFDPWKSGEARLPKNVSPLSMHRERTLTRHSRETRGCERCAIPSRGMRASSPLLIHPLSTLDKYSGNNTDGWWWGETCVSYTRLSCRSCVGMEYSMMIHDQGINFNRELSRILLSFLILWIVLEGLRKMYFFGI